MWAQRTGIVFLTINLEDVKDPDIKSTKDSVYFKGSGGVEKKNYEVAIPLYKQIDPEKSKSFNRERCIEIVLVKANPEDSYWPTLTSDKKKHHWLKCDFNKWQDEDDSGDEELSGGDKPSFDDLEDGEADSDDEPIPDLECPASAVEQLEVTNKDIADSTKFMESYPQNLAYNYDTLLHVFQYLEVPDLLRAGCVCTMWRDIASHPSLWRTVRVKNSQVHSFEGLANTLQKHGTIHLDLRKMLLPTNVGDDIWAEFSKAIQKLQTLRKIELCRCPASVVEQLAVTNKDIEVINAVTIKCESMSLDLLFSLRNLKELRLKSTSGLTLSSDITSLKELTNLKHLSLTSIKDLNKMNLNVISVLKNLESLDLGECTDFPENFAKDVLIELKSLEKLRLEKGQGNCHTFEILEAVKEMPHLEQLELVNFDIKTGFDVALGSCKNIRKLLIIPTYEYLSHSATTNQIVLGGVLRLQSTLSHFVWGVTLESIRCIQLFFDQCKKPDEKEERNCILCLKPIPSIKNTIPPAPTPLRQVQLLTLPDLYRLLLQNLPIARVKILKIPFDATWRQSITDAVFGF